MQARKPAAAARKPFFFLFSGLEAAITPTWVQAPLRFSEAWAGKGSLNV